MNKKMFCLNKEGIAEWVVSYSAEQAIKFYEEITGGSIKQTFEEERETERKYSRDLTWEDFIAGYIEEESPDKEIAFHHDDGRVETKTIQEFLDEITEVPSYFACSDW